MPSCHEYGKYTPLHISHPREEHLLLGQVDASPHSIARPEGRPILLPFPGVRVVVLAPVFTLVPKAVGLPTCWGGELGGGYVGRVRGLRAERQLGWGGPAMWRSQIPSHRLSTNRVQGRPSLWPPTRVFLRTAQSAYPGCRVSLNLLSEKPIAMLLISPWSTTNSSK